jgi:ABC-type transporter Mla MlaB component
MSQPSTMTIIVSRPLPDAMVVKIIGEVDQDSLSGENRQYSGLPNDNVLDTILADSVGEPCKLVIIDLTETRFLSSLAVATLVRFRKHIAPQGVEVRIAAGSNMIKLLKLARLEMLITIFADLNSALRG